jgi:pimeloyl-ACP methyl ester carboxylesterase
MEHVDVQGLRIGYERAGAGPPLVLLHGFVGDGRSTWSRQLEELSDEFTVVAWDTPGAGASSEPPEWFRSPHFADCLAGFIHALGLVAPHIVGLSFGGVVALELFRRHPDIPRTLVLAGGYAGWTGSLSPEQTEERLRFCLRAAELPPQEFVDAMIPSMFCDAESAGVAEFAKSMRSFSPVGFRIMARASAEADLRDVLAGVNAPTLLLYGDRDRRAPIPIAEALHTAIPGSRLVVLPGVGHVSCVEAPLRFNREVRHFIRSTGEYPYAPRDPR